MKQIGYLLVGISIVIFIQITFIMIEIHLDNVEEIRVKNICAKLDGYYYDENCRIGEGSYLKILKLYNLQQRLGIEN